jgi:hypothetical protein
MVLCEFCGNKRCPHAEDHRFTCTNSHEPDQVGTLAADCAQPERLPPGSLANAIEDAERNIAGWPNDVRAAMGVQPERQGADIDALRQLHAYWNGSQPRNAVKEQTAQFLFQYLQILDPNCRFSVEKSGVLCELRKGHAGPCGFIKQIDERPSPPPTDDIVAGLRSIPSIGIRDYADWQSIQRAIAALEKGCTREAVIRECWDAINKYIKPGMLPGNGCDESAQRNGMILASNVLMDMMVKS